MSFNFTDFKGAAIRLDDVDFPIMAHRISVSEDVMRAVVAVEAAGSGFDRQGRPKMLFEPHIFYRNLSGAKRARAVSEGLAYEDWRPGNYPSDSYPRLLKAMEIDAEAALKSASWGAGQILGVNHVDAGYGTIESMVEAFAEDEENHFEAMVAFILANNLDDDLRRLDWHGFARGYNGSGYKRNGYHTKLASAYARWQGIPDVADPTLPDPTSPGLDNGEPMKQVQLRLRELGYFETGTPDGVWGYKTRAAVLAFRADNDLPLVAGIDDKFLAAIAKATPRGVSKDRASATVEDLRADGSQTIKDGDDAEKIGVAAIGTGAVATVSVIAENSENVSKVFEIVEPVLTTIQDNLGLVLIAVGGLIVWKMLKVKNRRVEDHRSARHVGR